ncbi:SRPBCC family protein [Microlunatus ginsengisoli]|uniref:SRPBCC domain-containing protein n=1 Tax=Microlunatus ginsengisoli TaxID=363863 RepID=A0ABP6ZUH1_9ACTN
MTDALVFVTYIKATPEQVWDAITSNEFRRHYFHGSVVETSWDVGSQYRSFGPAGQLWGDNEILAYDPPRLLAHTWRSLYDPELAAEPSSRVTWTVEVDAAHPEVTKLTVVHDQLAGSPRTAESVRGWSFIVSGLKTLLETGEPLE